MSKWEARGEESKDLKTRAHPKGPLPRGSPKILNAKTHPAGPHDRRPWDVKDSGRYPSAPPRVEHQTKAYHTHTLRPNADRSGQSVWRKGGVRRSNHQPCQLVRRQKASKIPQFPKPYQLHLRWRAQKRSRSQKKRTLGA